MFARKKKGFLGVAAVVLAGSLVVPLLAIGTTASATTVRPHVTLSHANTVFSSGVMYSPPTVWNPNAQGSFATGTEGFLYETLFLYNPITNKYIPWLANSGKWTSTTKYVLTLRGGIKWVSDVANGQAVKGFMTGADVVFTIMLAKTDPGIYYSNLANDVSGATAVGNTVTVTFKHPAAEDWQSFLYQDPILPSSSVYGMGDWNNAELNTDANAAPVASGPMSLDSANTNSEEVCYTTNPNWWGANVKSLGNPSFKFGHWCDTVNSSNNVELTDFLTGAIDLSNNFLPGIAALIHAASPGGSTYGNISTYYPRPPYMLSANTVWLEPNLSKKPMSNLYFRKAVAAAVNESQIVNVDYTNLVDASNPTGLMPSQKSYIDTAAVKQYGFSFSKATAKADLKKSNYKGQTVTIECPSGWTDWMAAINLIVKDLKGVGIKAEALFPSYATRTSDIEDGTYDFAIDNNASIAADPYNYFYRMFRLPVQKVQSAQDNWERFDAATVGGVAGKAWGLVKDLNATAMTAKTARQAIFNKLETIELQYLPEIPVWYNGAWAQYSASNWKHWPHSTAKGDQYTPVMWAGWLGQMTTVLALAQLAHS
jgi:peptide/nickel transport system substrate-binding protein